MARFPTTIFLAAFALLCCLVYGLEDTISFGVTREEHDAATVNAASRLRRRQSAQLPNKLGKSLYWFGNFKVGDSGVLKLLVDTGSTDLLVNPGLYKPSKSSKKYGTRGFSNTYEGVNRNGFGFETVNGTTFTDKVSAAGLSFPDQPIGNITGYKYFDIKPLPYAGQGQGIIGFGGIQSSGFHPQAPSWFFNLCASKQLSSCNLGLAFGTSGKGQLNIGKVDNKAIDGDLVTVPQIKAFGTANNSYTTMGDVTVDGKIVLTDQLLIMDVGTDNLQAPVAAIDKIYRLLGYTPVVKKQAPTSFNPGQTIEVITAYFKCDKPPTVGFSFPAQSTLKKGQKATNFNVSTKKGIWDVFNNGGNNCTTPLGGTNALTYNTRVNGTNSTVSYWLVGQTFFSGHYTNFDIKANTIGYGNLKNPSTGTP